MPALGRRPLYRHGDVALLRAAAVPLGDAPNWWPDPGDIEACRTWLEQVWKSHQLAEAIRQASPSLADRIDAIRAGHGVQDKQVRRATVATVRYVLRATGRPTPFGLFAGVARVSLGSTAGVQWGESHRSVARVDTQWLADVVERIEAMPDLLERLDVVFNNLASRRGERLEVPHGQNRVTVRNTIAVRAVRDESRSPVRFAALVEKLSELFPGAERSTVGEMLAGLVRQGFLITGLRAPLTVVDPLAHLVERLREARVSNIAAVASQLCALESVQTEIRHHNDTNITGAEQGSARATINQRMGELSQAGRIPLAVDLLLDCEVHLPLGVARDMERAASALLRLTRRPTGETAWHSFHAAFCDRYGTGTLVPLTEVVDPDAGLGYPAGYPGNFQPLPTDGPSKRDERLLAMAWQAMADGSREITLTDTSIDALADTDRLDEWHIPPHVELAARIHATSAEALERGDYTLTVAPARAAGTLTSRFTPIATGSGLEEVYRALPAATEGALSAQMSFPPVYPHAENICRVPAYLPHVIPLGEHRGDDGTTIAIDDLAITATRDRLHLVSISHRRVVEPQVFHALALDKQPPPLARFLTHLPRAFSAVWHEFDWGTHARRLPYLPRLRYDRTVISPSRWRLTTDDLPAGEDGWQQALKLWRRRWQCPETVELRDADRTLRLTLDEPAHAAIVWAHLARRGHAAFTEAATATEFGWIDGHAHEIAVPLLAMRPAAPSPLIGSSPRLSNSAHGHLPGSPGATWIYAKIFTHPDRHDEIIAEYLPRLLATVDSAVSYWFVRFRGPHETDHLRLRIRTPDFDQYAEYSAAVGAWVQLLRDAGLAGRSTFDTYAPEVGRYGHGAAMDAAEAVFVADSHAVSAQLRRLPVAAVHPTALTAVSMVDIVGGFLGGPAEAMDWLTARPAPTVTAADRIVADHAVRLLQFGMLAELPGWPNEVAEAWQARSVALGHYRTQLPADIDTDAVLESLLHMHHNRAVGINSDGERICRRLARQAALAWRARQGEPKR